MSTIRVFVFLRWEISTGGDIMRMRTHPSLGSLNRQLAASRLNCFASGKRTPVSWPRRMKEGKAALLGEEALVPLVQALEGLLLRVDGTFGQPPCFTRVAPRGEPLAHLGVRSILLAARVPRTAARPAQASGDMPQLRFVRRAQPELEAVGTNAGFTY